MPINGKATFTGDTDIHNINLKMFYQSLWDSTKSKMRLTHRFIRYALYNRTGLGMGIYDLESLYHTAKIDCLLHSLDQHKHFLYNVGVIVAIVMLLYYVAVPFHVLHLHCASYNTSYSIHICVPSSSSSSAFYIIYKIQYIIFYYIS